MFVVSGINISSKIDPGFFSVTFSYILYVISPFLGPAVPPPTKGPQTCIFSRNSRLASKLLFFPVRAVAQGSLCVRFPYHRGWSSRGAADFRCTKTMLWIPFLEKMPAQIKKMVLKQVALHEQNRYALNDFQNMQTCPKMAFQTCKSSRNIMVPEPLVFSIQERPPLQKLAVKRVTKRRIGRNLPTTIFLDQNAGTHDSGSRNSGTHDSGSRKIAPELCVPLFL